MIYPTIIDLILLTNPGVRKLDERNTAIMETKYGTITKEQFEEYKKQLHGMIHWLLVYKEKNYEDLDAYFSSVLFRISGFNSVLNYPPNILTLMATLESARLENLKEDYDHKKYRKAILDAHSIVDKIGEYEESIEKTEESVENYSKNNEETIAEVAAV